MAQVTQTKTEFSANCWPVTPLEITFPCCLELQRSTNSSQITLRCQSDNWQLRCLKTQMFWTKNYNGSYLAKILGIKKRKTSKLYGTHKIWGFQLTSPQNKLSKSARRDYVFLKYELKTGKWKCKLLSVLPLKKKKRQEMNDVPVCC